MSGPVWQEFAGNMRIGALTGMIGGVILGLLFAAATLALNPILLGSSRDVVVLTLGLVLVYGVFCLALGLIGALGKTAIFARTGQHVSDTKTAAFVTGAVFFTICAVYGYSWCRWHRIGGLGPEGHAGTEQIPIVLTILAVAALLARLMTYAFYLLIVFFKKPERRQPGDLTKAFLVLAYMSVAFAIFLTVLRLTRPDSVPAVALKQEDIVETAPMRVLAIDGLGSTDLQRLSGRGLLDPLEGYLRGNAAEVAWPGHDIAPAIWTEVATGRPLEGHGISGYQAQVVRGLSRSFTVGPNQVGLFQLFQDVLPFFRLTRPVPLRSSMRGSKGLWNIATDAALTTAVTNWWVSWPAERVLGVVISDHTYLRLQVEAGNGLRSEGETYPGSLLAEVAGFADAENETVASAVETFETLGLPGDVLQSDVFYARAAMHVLGTVEPHLWMLHLPGPDVVRRLLLRDVHDPVERKRRLDVALDTYASTIFPILAPLGAELGVRTVWLSLPGTPLPGEDARQGRIVVSSPERTAPNSELPEVHLPDLAPTFLWLLGLPFSEDMPGSVRTDFADADTLGPPRSVVSYGGLKPPDEPFESSVTDPARLELLRSLGYID